jgi:hypothetical protein
MLATANTSTMNDFWPLPALLAWALGWGLFRALEAMALPVGVAVALAAAAPAALAWGARGLWRRLIMAGGFPLSVLALGVGAAVPAWVWLLPLALLLVVYPVQAWRDAPIYPTAPKALVGLDRLIPLVPGARILDAGCGLGHGLQALRQVWPQAAIEGLERSRPLAWAARARCPWAAIRAGDMWQASWKGLALVYIFQRPDTMARAWKKACAEVGPDGWLASLEFEVPGVAPHAVLHRPGQRPVHVYRLDPVGRAVPAQPRRTRADKTPRKPADPVLG